MRDGRRRSRSFSFVALTIADRARRRSADVGGTDRSGTAREGCSKVARADHEKLPARRFLTKHDERFASGTVILTSSIRDG
jgi:hypothetical protein